MASTIAGQNNAAIGTCVADWYYTSNAVQAQRNDEVRHEIRRNPGYHPSSVILAMLYKECGRF